MNIWKDHKQFQQYVENSLRYVDFKEWRSILTLQLQEPHTPEQKIMHYLLMADCHFYLNDGKAAGPLDEMANYIEQISKQKQINILESNDQLDLYVQAYQELLKHGNFPKAYDAFYKLATNYGDIHALKRGQLIAFLSGKSQTDIAVNFDAQKCIFGGNYYYAMASFAFGEEQDYKKASEYVQKGLELKTNNVDNDAWLHHAHMHNLFFTEQDTKKCIQISEKYQKCWGNLNAFLKSHNNWHLALFYLENQEEQKAFSVFQLNLWNFPDQTYLENLINVIQFLWKIKANEIITTHFGKSGNSETLQIEEQAHKAWHTVCTEIVDKKCFNNIGYLMYNVLICKTLFEFGKKDIALNYLNELRTFCEKNAGKTNLLPLINFLFSDYLQEDPEQQQQNTNKDNKIGFEMQEIQKSFDHISEFLGSVEQLLIFKECVVAKLIKHHQYDTAKNLIEKELLSKRPCSSIYQRWLQLLP